MSAKPRDLLAWFMDGYRAETPTNIHSGSVFVGRPNTKGVASFDPKTGEPHEGRKELSGGSVLGAPNYESSFRSWLEDGPMVTEIPEYEGHLQRDVAYKFPMRAALARLGGRGPAHEMYPFMARFLYRVACRDGDWLAAALSMGIPEPVALPYRDVALRRLFEKFEEEPPARTIREPEVAA